MNLRYTPTQCEDQAPRPYGRRRPWMYFKNSVTILQYPSRYIDLDTLTLGKMAVSSPINRFCIGKYVFRIRTQNVKLFLKMSMQNLGTIRDVTTGKFLVQPLRWWGRIFPPGWNRVKVSENLCATAVAPIAPLVTSLTIINKNQNHIYLL